LNLTEVASAASAALTSDPSIHTLVVGVGPESCDLHQIASAGGAEQALFAEQGNLTSRLIEALEDLKAKANRGPCEFEIPDPPDGYPADLHQVRVHYTPSGALAAEEEVPGLDGIEACASSKCGGWYYDNLVAPARLLVCPCTCERFVLGSVRLEFGCGHLTP
jgi:hypothetical protein